MATIPGCRNGAEFQACDHSCFGGVHKKATLVRGLAWVWAGGISLGNGLALGRGGFHLLVSRASSESTASFYQFRVVYVADARLDHPARPVRADLADYTRSLRPRRVGILAAPTTVMKQS